MSLSLRHGVFSDKVQVFELHWSVLPEKYNLKSFIDGRHFLNTYHHRLIVAKHGIYINDMHIQKKSIREFKFYLSRMLKLNRVYSSVNERENYKIILIINKNVGFAINFRKTRLAPTLKIELQILWKFEQPFYKRKYK